MSGSASLRGLTCIVLSTSGMVAGPNKAGPGCCNDATICSIPINICRLTLTSSVNMPVISCRTGPAKTLALVHVLVDADVWALKEATHSPICFNDKLAHTLTCRASCLQMSADCLQAHMTMRPSSGQQSTIGMAGNILALTGPEQQCCLIDKRCPPTSAYCLQSS